VSGAQPLKPLPAATSDASGLAVADDLPAAIPVVPDEIAAIETFLGPLLDEFLHPGLTNRSRKRATKF
jgi:hypothetical protein